MIDIDTYLNRITSEHKTKPKFMALLAARLQIFADIAELLAGMDEAFDIDTVVGVQLDTIGEYVGVKRLLSFQPQNAPSLLPDDYYRLLLKAKISLNVWDGTAAGVLQIWRDIFPDYTIEVFDNQDMSITVRIQGLNSLFESEIIQHGYINPKPMGVLLNYNVSFETNIGSKLYVGAYCINRIMRTELPPPKPPTDFDVEGNIFAIGISAENIVKSDITFRPAPSEDEQINGEVHALGMIISKTIRLSVEEKPYADLSGELASPAQVYTAGLLDYKQAKYGIRMAHTAAQDPHIQGAILGIGIVINSTLKRVIESAAL